MTSPSNGRPSWDDMTMVEAFAALREALAELGRIIWAHRRYLTAGMVVGWLLSAAVIVAILHA